MKHHSLTPTLTLACAASLLLATGCTETDEGRYREPAAGRNYPVHMNTPDAQSISRPPAGATSSGVAETNRIPARPPQTQASPAQSTERTPAARPATATKTISVAVARLRPTEGKAVQGTVIFTNVADGLRVIANLTGLSPGKHGIHIHEKGDCSAPDATSAGGHWNPTGAPHGAPTDPEHHLGDLGNIEASAEGKATYDKTFSFLSLTGTNSVVGKAVIVHADEDDLKSQPTGNAGGRLACGIIQAP